MNARRVVGALVAASLSSEGAIIDSSPGYPGEPFGSWTISGASGKDNTEPATQFVVGGSDAILESATILVQHEGGENSFTVAVLADNGGEPGAVLDSVPGLVFPSWPDEPIGDVVASFSGGITLDAGTAYWLLVSPGSNSEGFWYDSNVAPVTPIATRAASGGAWNVTASPARAINFQVEGTLVPEPGVVLLVGLGGLLLGTRRRH